MWQKRLTKGITGTPRPPPPPTHLPSYALWHSYWAACFRHSMRNRSGNGLLMRNRSQNGHDEKKLRALDWWVHFQKKALKGGSQEAPEPPPPPRNTHTDALWHSYWVAHFRQYVKPLSKWAPQEKAQSYRPVGLFSLSELTWGQCERHESSHWNCHIYSQTNKVILAALLLKWPWWEKAQSSKPVRSFSISKFIWGRPLYETWELLLEPLYLQKN